MNLEDVESYLLERLNEKYYILKHTSFGQDIKIIFAELRARDEDDSKPCNPSHEFGGAV